MVRSPRSQAGGVLGDEGKGEEEGEEEGELVGWLRIQGFRSFAWASERADGDCDGPSAVNAIYLL
ncbi:hypothetical protein GCM10010217_46880 [Streptomyces tubercidicus]